MVFARSIPTVVLICLSAMLLVMENSGGLAADEAGSPRSTVLNRLWIWTQPGRRS